VKIFFEIIESVIFSINNIFQVDYGCGYNINYDFPKIGSLLAHALISNASYITTHDLVYFSYTHELFHGHSGILFEISRKIPQIPFSNDLHMLLLQSVSNDQMPSLLGLLHKILYFLKRTGGSPENNLGHYLTQFFDGIHSDPIFSKFLKMEILIDIPLKHMLALYHIVEDAISQNVILNLHFSYKGVVPKEVKNFLSYLEFPLAEHVLSTALKRFAHRYLVGNNLKLREEESF